MRRRFIVFSIAASAFFVTSAAAFGVGRAGTAYTKADATAGSAVYQQDCSTCHGAHLQGNSGPTLVGKSIREGYPTASKLYDFISKQMPANDPGSLSTTQYRDVTAFILQKNGLLNKADPPRSDPPATEMQLSVPPKTTTINPIPSSAKIDLTNSDLVNAASDSRDWLIDGRAYDNDRYSPLDQITASNVDTLRPAALIQTGMTASFETTPIVTDGVMYITTPTVNDAMKVMSFNAATGEPYWSTTIDESGFQICCGPVNRGAAVANGMVYVATLDDHLVALDARTGKVRWAVSVANPSVGYSETMAPVAYDGMVIVGSAGGEWALRGFIAAYNAQTGKQDWRYYTTVPSTYSGNSWQTGGATVWTTPAIDPKRGLIVFSTGNPNPDLNGINRKGSNEWSDSIVALDVHTGKFKWGYQEVKHDVWDYDAVSPVVLFDVTENGKTIPAAGEAGKVGWFFIVNRETGKLIRKSAPLVRMNANMFKPPTKAGVDTLPGANGGAEWSPPAYSPKTHMAYALEMDQLMHFTIGEPTAASGHLRLGSAFVNVKPNGVQDGRFVAVNVDTGRVAWTAITPQPLMGGALVTAGNLAFVGEGDGWFDAYDATSGKRLWRYYLGAGVNAPAVSYEVNGTQYIAVGAGGNFQLGYPYGDTIAIFKL
jgi:alcohol dehydrogenase (cytochrome c)